jgi:hypothetical protein
MTMTMTMTKNQVYFEVATLASEQTRETTIRDDVAPHDAFLGHEE